MELLGLRLSTFNTSIVIARSRLWLMVTLDTSVMKGPVTLSIINWIFFQSDWWKIFQYSLDSVNFIMSEVEHLFKKFLAISAFVNVYPFHNFQLGYLGVFLINLPVHFGTFLCLEIFLFVYYLSFDGIYWFVYLLAYRKCKVLCCQFIHFILLRSQDLFLVWKGLPHSGSLCGRNGRGWWPWMTGLSWSVEIKNKLTGIFF